MIVRKQWRLNALDVTSLDIKFMVSLGCAVHVEPSESSELIGPDGKTYRYNATNPFVLVVSTCEKQESMLKLKFGDSIVLQQVVHTTHNIPTHLPFL
jgi:hypothetical protein